MIYHNISLSLFSERSTVLLSIQSLQLCCKGKADSTLPLPHPPCVFHHFSLPITYPFPRQLLAGQCTYILFILLFITFLPIHLLHPLSPQQVLMFSSSSTFILFIPLFLIFPIYFPSLTASTKIVQRAYVLLIIIFLHIQSLTTLFLLSHLSLPSSLSVGKKPYIKNPTQRVAPFRE